VPASSPKLCEQALLVTSIDHNKCKYYVDKKTKVKTRECTPSYFSNYL
jgi:hypothetical protein